MYVKQNCTLISAICFALFGWWNRLKKCCAKERELEMRVFTAFKLGIEAARQRFRGRLVASKVSFLPHEWAGKTIKFFFRYKRKKTLSCFSFFSSEHFIDTYIPYKENGDFQKGYFTIVRAIVLNLFWSLDPWNLSIIYIL